MTMIKNHYFYYTAPDARLNYIGRQKDGESSLADHGVREYDYDLGQFTSPDPLWENYYAWTPYHYCRNNPVMAVDPSGLDEKERAAAMNKAMEYEASNSTFELGEKGQPGEKVDCSGMASRCIRSAGSKFLPLGVTGTCADQLSKSYTEVGLDEVQPGNLVVKKNSVGEGAHCAIVIAPAVDKDGNRVGVYVIESSSFVSPYNGKTGPCVSLWTDSGNHYYKWDSPDKKGENNQDYQKAWQNANDLIQSINYDGTLRMLHK